MFAKHLCQPRKRIKVASCCCCTATKHQTPPQMMATWGLDFLNAGCALPLSRCTLPCSVPRPATLIKMNEKRFWLYVPGGVLRRSAAASVDA